MDGDLSIAPPPGHQIVIRDSLYLAETNELPFCNAPDSRYRNFMSAQDYCFVKVVSRKLQGLKVVIISRADFDKRLKSPTKLDYAKIIRQQIWDLTLMAPWLTWLIEPRTYAAWIIKILHRNETTPKLLCALMAYTACKYYYIDTIFNLDLFE